MCFYTKKNLNNLAPMLHDPKKRWLISKSSMLRNKDLYAVLRI